MSDQIITNEAKGFEVEAKLSVPNSLPDYPFSATDRLMDVMDAVYEGKFPSWEVLPSKGAVESVRTWRLDIGAWGVQDGDQLCQQIMLVERPDGLKMVNQKETCVNFAQFRALSDDFVLIRPENKSHCSRWLSQGEFEQVWREMQENHPELQLFGVYHRTKASFQVVSPNQRVFTLSIDLSQSEGRVTLTQMEVEYKHSLRPLNPEIQQVAGELEKLLQLMSQNFGYRPYLLTKLEWLTHPAYREENQTGDFL